MRGLPFSSSPPRGEDARRADEGDKQQRCEAFESKRQAIIRGSSPLIRPVGHLLPEGRRGGVAAIALLLSIILFPIATFAVNPDEVLPDPALEARARAISMELRCMVCQNQSIDDSNADLARDLRLLVRKRLVDGDTDAQVIDYLVSRYGEFVLLKPRLSERTWILWGAPIGLLLVGGLAMAVFARRRSGKPAGTPLTSEEQARLDQLLQE